MSPETRQRSRLWFRKERRRVVGVFYEDGLRTREVLCTWEQARVTGVDAEGRAQYRTAADRAWSQRYLLDLYVAKRRELLEGRPEHAPSRRIGAVMGEWVAASEATRARATVKGYRALRALYLRAAGDHPVADLGLVQVDRLMAALRERKLAPATINASLNALKAFCRWAADRRYIKERPKIALLRAPVREPKIPTMEQIGALLERIRSAWAATKDERHRHFYRLHMRAAQLMLGAGLRRGEVWALPWAHLDLEGGWVRVLDQPHHRVKEGRDKVCAIAPPTLDLLRAERHAHPAEVWFLDDGAGNRAYQDPHALSTAFARHKAEVGLEDLGKATHAFRAWYATESLAGGTDLATLQRQLGHASMTTTALYQGRIGDAKQVAAQVLGRKLEPIWNQPLPPPDKILK